MKFRKGREDGLSVGCREERSTEKGSYGWTEEITEVGEMKAEKEVTVYVLTACLYRSRVNVGLGFSRHVGPEVDSNDHSRR